MLVLKNMWKYFHHLCLMTQLHTYMQHWNITNKHQPQSLFRIYTFNNEAICVIVPIPMVETTQYTTSNNMCSYLHPQVPVRRPQAPLMIFQGTPFGSILNFSSASTYLTITSAFTNVDFRSDATWSTLCKLTVQQVLDQLWNQQVRIIST